MPSIHPPRHAWRPISRLLPPRSGACTRLPAIRLVVEIGCNDGIMLRHFAAAGIRHLGIEPSANVARAAAEAGIEVVSEFFDAALADNILDTHGPADAVMGANVMCHIPYLHSVFEGVRRLLKPGGVFIFEDPYLGDIVRKAAYDQIYDEHVFYFCATAIASLAARHGLALVDVAPPAGSRRIHALYHRPGRRAGP